MSLIKIATAKAHIPAVGNGKSRYLTVGSLFKDDTERLVLKIDMLPVSGWFGWINLFELSDEAERKLAPDKGPDFNDDIPF